MNLRTALASFGFAVFLLCALLFAYFPAVPRSAVGWLALITLGLPVYFLLEWLGERVLSSSVFSNRSSGTRILLAIPVVALLMVLAALLIRMVQAVITWA